MAGDQKVELLGLVCIHYFAQGLDGFGRGGGYIIASEIKEQITLELQHSGIFVESNHWIVTGELAKQNIQLVGQNRSALQ